VRNATFFDSIDSELTAYWFGFLCADGCVYRSAKQCAVTLAARDRKHLERFARLFERPVWQSVIRDDRTGRDYGRVRCVLSSKHLCASLLDHGLKDGARPFDYVPHWLLGPFLRGYFDGDGHVGVVRETQWRVTFVGNHAFLARVVKPLAASLAFAIETSTATGRSTA
jgi:hypothetical protein